MNTPSEKNVTVNLSNIDTSGEVLGVIAELRAHMDNRLAEVENSLTAKIVALVNVEIDKFRHEMTNKFSDVEKRLSHVENVSSETYTDAAITDRVNKVVESKVTDTVTETHKQIKEDIQRLSKTFNDTGDGLTLIVRKLPESTNKNVENKVNTMIQKG